MTGIIPPEEDRRLEAVRRYDILDTPPDGAFDRVTAIASRVCGTPISTITIVDHDRIWFKSTHGIEVEQIDRDPGLCASAILRSDLYEVADAKVDPRTLDNPLVRGELGLRFYAAVPLITQDGYRLGTLNVIDVEPRELTDDQRASLEDLAHLVVDELELRLAARRKVELESLREAAELRDAIVAGMSHEMRTPLAVLRGLVGLVGDETSGEPGEIRELMHRQVRYLDWLVAQFLDYAGLESGDGLAVELAPVDLVALVQQAVEVLAHRATIEIEVERDVPAVMADGARTFRIVVELLNNAVRFAGHGEPVTVHVRPRGSDRVCVAVTDHGPGISADVMDQLFDAFHRGAGSTGAGVGLFVGQRFAQAMDGRIEVESTPGEGSTFTLVLPTAGGDDEDR